MREREEKKEGKKEENRADDNATIVVRHGTQGQLLSQQLLAHATREGRTEATWPRPKAGFAAGLKGAWNPALWAWLFAYHLI